MSRDPALCRAFVYYAKAFLKEYPQIEHTWSIEADEDHCILNIPKKNDRGFDITVEVCADEINLFCEGFHDHYSIEGTPDDFANYFVGFLYNLLSPVMRISEVCSGGVPYKWILESRQQGEWISDSITGLIFYNYFGKRSKRIYQNESLKEREDAIIPETDEA